jgi:hypothetical protein
LNLDIEQFIEGTMYHIDGMTVNRELKGEYGVRRESVSSLVLTTIGFSIDNYRI